MRRLLGIGAFLAAAALALFYAFADRTGGDPLANLLRFGRPPPVAVMGYIGGEKLGFLDDPEVKDILRDRYGLVLDARKAGSIEMVTDPAIITQKPSFLWPSTQLALDLARDTGLASRPTASCSTRRSCCSPGPASPRRWRPKASPDPCRRSAWPGRSTCAHYSC